MEKIMKFHLWMSHSLCHEELTVATDVYIGSAQECTHQQSDMDGGWGSKVSIPTTESYATQRFSKRLAIVYPLVTLLDISELFQYQTHRVSELQIPSLH